MNNIKVGPKILAGFGIALLMILVIGAVSYINITNLYNNALLVTHTYQVELQVDLIHTTLTDAETGQRGYIITGEDEYLAPYNAALQQIDGIIEELRKQTIDNPKQQERIVSLKPLVQAKLDELKETIALRREKGFDAALQVVVTDKGKTVMDNIRTLTDAMTEEEHTLLKQRDTDSQNSLNNTIFLIIAGSILSLAVLTTLGIVITRSITIPLQQVTQAAQHIANVDLQAMTMALNAMAQGDLSHELSISSNLLNINTKDESGQLAQAFNVMITSLKDASGAYSAALGNLRGLVAEAGMLTRAGVEGKLATRGDASKFKGGYHEIVQGVNNTLDAVIGPLNVAAAYVDKIAGGVIPPQITDTYNGDFNTLKNNLNRMSQRLREMLVSISDASANLTSATAEILAATTQQASGASEQSAAISQTTTTVEEVKASAEQAAMRAQDVATASQRTVEVARSGQGSVQATIESMAMIKERVEGISENLLALSDQTQQIGEIIATVNEIASQSNMLALNASVEAARAGEHGKGFAVVATEVRSLAEQSRQATEQIKAILSEIQKATNSTVMATEEGVKGVDRGVQLSTQSRESIEQLSAVINESAQVAAQVVASGQQQQTGIDQISLAMQNINQVTMQSLASTRQTEKSAQSLNELARRMSEVLAQYRF